MSFLDANKNIIRGGGVEGGEVVGGSAGSGGRLVVRGAARCA